MKNNQQELYALTGLRFIAALYVFVFHIHIRWPVTEIRFIKKVLSQGAIGMSLFFILSGFVLAYRYAFDNTSPATYFINRFARIYPVYAVAALITIPWLGLSFGEGHLFDIGKTVIQGILLLIANICLIQAWFPQFFDYWNNGGSWSISVEAFCYALLPFVLPTLARLSFKQVMVFVALCYVLTCMSGIVGFIFPDAPRGVYYSMPIYRLPEFLIGVCGYLAFRHGWLSKVTTLHQFACIGLMVIYLGIFGNKIQNYVGHNWIVVPFMTLMIVTLAHGRGMVAKCLAQPMFVWFGKISYCFYSFQPFVIFMLIRYHVQLKASIPLLNNRQCFLLFAFVALLMIAAIGYYGIEEPIRQKIKKRDRFRQKPAQPNQSSHSGQTPDTQKVLPQPG